MRKLTLALALSLVAAQAFAKEPVGVVIVSEYRHSIGHKVVTKLFGTTRRHYAVVVFDDGTKRSMNLKQSRAYIKKLADKQEKEAKPGVDI